MKPKELYEKVQKLRPTIDEKKTLKSTINRIENILINSSQFSVRKVVPGGSLKKGTMIRGHFEADVVFIIESFGFQSFSDLQQIAIHVLRNNFPKAAKIRPQNISIRLELNKPINRMMFDILIGYEINSPSQMTWVKMTDFYRGSTTKFHIEYVKQQKDGSCYVEMVLLLKDWIQRQSLPLSGFQIELIAAQGVERCEYRGLVEHLKSCYSTIVSFCDGETIYPVDWNYFSYYQVTVGKSAAGVLVVDPGDPSNNVASNLSAQHIRDIKNAANRELSKFD